MPEPNKTELKKLQKRDALLEAAYALFIEQGLAPTTVEQIVRRAGVAKGTFYLYYKDKEEILRELILFKSEAMLTDAMREARLQEPGDFTARVIYITDFTVEYFRKYPLVLRLIYRDLARFLISERLDRGDSGELDVLVAKFMAGLRAQGHSPAEASVLMFMIVELIGAVCYSSIIDFQPVPIDPIKPILFDAIRRLISRAPEG